MSRDVLIKAGERTRVLHMVSDSIPSKPRFRAEAVNGGPVSGKIDIHRGLFGGSAEHHDLNERNVVTKGFWDANYSIYVTPDTDTKITFETRHFRASMLVWVLLIVVAMGLIAGLPAFLAATPSGN